MGAGREIKNRPAGGRGIASHRKLHFIAVRDGERGGLSRAEAQRFAERCD